MKPDLLTRRWDVYLKEGGSDYASINPQNLRPVFTQHQLSSSLRATNLAPTVLRAASLLDTEQIRSDILANLADNPVAKLHIGLTSDPRWVTDQDGFLQLDNQTYVPEAEDLRLRILQYKHDHILSGHFGVAKTLELIRRDYVWPGM
jgi:Integrase zinc binding domain